jgi:hypothetical protein
MAARPRHIGNILQQDALGSLYAKIEQQQQLLTAVRRQLPAELRPHCVSAVLERGRLTLGVDSPVWGSRLRFLTPTLLTPLRAHYPGIANIQIRIQARDPARAGCPTRPRRPRIHSEQAAAAVEQASSGIPDPALAKSLKRLARTLRGQ